MRKHNLETSHPSTVARIFDRCGTIDLQHADSQNFAEDAAADRVHQE